MLKSNELRDYMMRRDWRDYMMRRAKTEVSYFLLLLKNRFKEDGKKLRVSAFFSSFFDNLEESYLADIMVFIIFK